jgi:hypothetical protein
VISHPRRCYQRPIPRCENRAKDSKRKQPRRLAGAAIGSHVRTLALAVLTSLASLAALSTLSATLSALSRLLALLAGLLLPATTLLLATAALLVLLTRVLLTHAAALATLIGIIHNRSYVRLTPIERNVRPA